MKSAVTWLLLTRLFFAINIGISYDEAYYWSWSKNLSLSYYDHPAMVAHMIKVSTLIFGDTALGIRFFPLVFSLLASYAIYYLGRKAIDENAGLYASIFFQATLLIGVGGLIMTPDLPLLTFWIATLVAVFKLVETGRGEWWLAIGASLGFAFMSKYSAAFLIIGVIVFAFTRLQDFKKPWIYLGAFAAMLAASPVFIWNYQNDWISFIKQGERAVVKEFNPINFIEFIAGQGLLLTPFIVILCAFGLRILPKNTYIRILIYTSLPLFLFLIWQSLFSKVEGNWAAPLFIFAVIIASVAHKSVWLYKNSAPYGIILSTLILAFISFKPFNLPPNLTDQLYGGKKVAETLRAIPHDGIITQHYTTNAWLRYHLGTIAKVQQPNEPLRYLHESKVTFENPIYVGEERHLRGLKGNFQEITRVQYGSVWLSVWRLIK